MASTTWHRDRPVSNEDDASLALDDEVLVARAIAVAGEFAPLYRRYVRPIYAYCVQRLGRRDLAEDATSLVFTKALAALPRYRARSFRAWLFTIARNVATDVQRERSMTPLGDAPWLEAAEPSPEDRALASDAARRVRDLLLQLTPLQRDVVELRVLGLETAEISVVLNRRPGAVRSAEFRAYQRLRDVLDRQGDE